MKDEVKREFLKEVLILREVDDGKEEGGAGGAEVRHFQGGQCHGSNVLKVELDLLEQEDSGALVSSGRFGPKSLK